MKKSRISVAIATYNGESYIIDQLASIYNQTRCPDEVIICDDKSTDNTVNVIREFIKANELSTSWKVYTNERNLGFIKNFLRAISLTTGDIIFLSDQDDVFYETKFERMAEILLSNEGCELINANYEIIDKDGNTVKDARSKARVRKKGLRKIEFTEWLYESSFPGFSMGFKSVIRDKLRYCNIEHCYGHDQLISLLAISDDADYETSEVLSGYRSYEGNTTGGTNITHNYILQSRINQKKKELSEYNKLTEMIKNNDIDNVDYHFLNAREHDLEKRIENLSKQSFGEALKLILKCKTYPKGTLIGDLIYIAKGKKL